MAQSAQPELQPVQPKPSVCKNLFAMIKAVPHAVVAPIAAAIFAFLATRYMYVEAEGEVNQ